MADSSREYKLREVVFQGQKNLVILQNPDEWSAAVEIANFLLLSEIRLDGMEIKKKDGEQYLNLDMIHNMIYTHICTLLEVCVHNGTLTQDLVKSIRPVYKDAICEPSSHFNMYPSSFRRITDFEQNFESCVLDALRVVTYHGWILDPEDTATIKAVGTKSCKEVIKEFKEWKESKSECNVHTMSIIQIFLEKWRTQLTSSGLACLCKDVPEGYLSLLFRNDQLSVLYKHKGTLNTLVTSQDVVENHPDAVWRKMEKVEEHGYVTCTFDPINTISWWEMRDILLKEEANEKKQKQKIEKKKLKRKEKRLIAQGESGEPNAHISEETKAKHEEKGLAPQKVAQGESGEANADFSNETKATHEDKGPTPQKVSLGNKFMQFLEECKHDGISYFKGQVEAMLLTGSSHLTFCYKLIQTHDEDLATFICNDYYRVSEDLRHCFCDYFSKIQKQSVVIRTKLKSAMDETEIYTNIKLTICCVPEHKRILSFKKFTAENEMYIVYEDDGILVISTSYVGRMMALGFLQFILKIHESGMSWNGEFSESHMSVEKLEGVMVFKIKMLGSMVHLNKESGIADFNKYKDIIFPHFKSPDVKDYPAYFDDFVVDFMEMPDPINSPKESERFREYMYSHLFAKAPLVRSFLITNTFRACQSLIIERPNPGSFAVYCPLTKQDKSLPQWIKKDFTAPVRNIYDYKSLTSNGFDKTTHWNVLTLSRNVTEHLHLYTKRNKVQTIKDLVIVDLRLARDLGGYIARTIKYIIMNPNLDGLFPNVFASVWRTFKASETFDESKKDAAVGDTKTGTGAMVTLPSLGSASSASGPPTAPAAKAPSGSATAASSASGSPTAPAAKAPFLMLECVMEDQRVQLSCDDLKSLNDNTYLFDSIIDFGFARISLTFNNSNDILLLRTSVATLLAGLQGEDALQVMFGALDRERLQSCRLVFIPVSDNTSHRLDSGEHWSLLVIHIAEDRAGCRFVHHDSLGVFNSQAARRYAAVLMLMFPPSDEVIEAQTPKQEGPECGLAVLALTEKICSWWNKRGRPGKSMCWIEMVNSNVTASTYTELRPGLRNNLKRLALATATAAALDFAAGTGAAPDLGTATPLPAPTLQFKVRDKVVELLREEVMCLGEKETFVVDKVFTFVYNRISLIFKSQDLLLMWPTHDFLNGEEMSVETEAKSLLGSCRMVLLPVSDIMDSMHSDRRQWTLLVVQIDTDRSSCRFFHHNLGGLNNNVAMKYVKALQRLFPESQPVIKDHIPQQINAFDSGLYVLCLIKAICTWWTRSGRSGNLSYSFNEVENISGHTLTDTRIKLSQTLMKELGDLASGPTD